MKTLLLFVPSAVAIAVLMWHAWSHRGRRIALSFFISAFLFGVVRGNVIHWITVESQGGVMPYVFTQPVVQIFSASLQAVIGWIFALYVSWWLAERVLARIPALKGDLMATVGMTCVGMAAVGYGVEGGAAAAGWWVWSIPTHNRFFVGVPTVGIAEWFAVGFEFFIPYFLAFCTPYRRRVLGARAVGRISFSHVLTPVFRADFTRGAHTALCTLALDKHPDPGRSGTNRCRLHNCGNSRKQAQVATRIDVGMHRPVHWGNGHSAGGHWRTTRPANFADPAGLTVSHGIVKSIHALYSGLCGCRLGS